MKPKILEIYRYLINGTVATLVHFTALNVIIYIFEFKSAGFSNFIAAIFGITTSFLGSRYYVFKSSAQGVLHQALKFGGFYVLVAVLHGLFLWCWTDNYGFDYRLGFLIATCLQVLVSYFGNKFFVFK